MLVLIFPILNNSAQCWGMYKKFSVKVTPVLQFHMREMSVSIRNQMALVLSFECISFIVTLVFNIYQADGRLYSVSYNSYTFKTKIKDLYKVGSVQACVVHCASNDQCLHVLYERGTQTCSLMTGTNDVAIAAMTNTFSVLEKNLVVLSGNIFHPKQ